MPSKTISLVAILAAGALAAAAIPATAQTPEQFFKGKTITFYVGLSPGGGYDLNARLVAKHFGKYVPGNPNVIVKNMPGGGGLVMIRMASISARRNAAFRSNRCSAMRRTQNTIRSSCNGSAAPMPTPAWQSLPNAQA